MMMMVTIMMMNKTVSFGRFEPIRLVGDIVSTIVKADLATIVCAEW